MIYRITLCALLLAACRSSDKVVDADAGIADLRAPDLGPVACADGVLDGDETDVDCGGSCRPCAQGQKCAVAKDCGALACVGSVCVTACLDGVKDGDETDVDCGGVFCDPCALGKSCLADYQCVSVVCQNDVCVAPNCTDGKKDGDEPDLDCGGSAPGCPACAIGKHCSTDAQCEAGDVCGAGYCTIPSCDNGVKDNDESDVDCGGTSCPPCALHAACTLGSQCASGTCETSQCVASFCTDGVKDADEPDVDCGSASCLACANGKSCQAAFQCASELCIRQTCTIPSCNNGVQDNTETDVDCGDAPCPRCAIGRKCDVGADCASGLCSRHVCLPASCGDGVLDNGESDIDCGGGTCGACGWGGACNTNGDCSNGPCVAGKCATLVTPLAVPAALTATSSIDSGDNGKSFYVTTLNWSIYFTPDGGTTWGLKYDASGNSLPSGKGRIHASRSTPGEIVEYGFADTQTSDYSPYLIVTHDGFLTSSYATNGVSGWGTIAAFSDTDSQRVYIFSDNGGSKLSTDAATTFASIAPSPAFTSLITPGAAAVSPLSATNAFITESTFIANPAQLFAYDYVAKTLTDVSSSVVSALGGSQRPHSFEIYSRGTNLYRMRVIGTNGAIATSDDLSTFSSSGASSQLGTCGTFSLRQIVSSPSNRDTIVCWCPKSTSLSESTNGGKSWSSASSAAWTSTACQVTGVVISGPNAIVSCQNTKPVALAL